jgi:aquaporin Z
MQSTRVRAAIAEFIGTFMLVFLAVGAAVFGIAGFVGADKTGPANGVVGVALAFGLVLLGIAYAFGPVSGAHVNPAVTLAMLLGRRMSGADALIYWIAQFLGAIAAGGLLKLFVSSMGVTDQTGGLGTNSFDNGAINGPGAFVLEVVLTAAFVLVILLVTERVAAPGFAGIAIGLTLTLVHLVGIPLDGTSVNPARSFGPALFAGGDALGQVWLFILAPLVGSVVAVIIWKVTRTTKEESSEAPIAGSEREIA